MVGRRVTGRPCVRRAEWGCRPRRSGPGGSAVGEAGGAFGEQLDPSRGRSSGGHRALIPGLRRRRAGFRRRARPATAQRSEAATLRSEPRRRPMAAWRWPWAAAMKPTAAGSASGATAP